MANAILNFHFDYWHSSLTHTSIWAIRHLSTLGEYWQRAICPSLSIVKARGSGRNDAKRNPLHYSTSPLAPPGIWLAWEGTRRINHKFGAPQQQCVEPIAAGG